MHNSRAKIELKALCSLPFTAEAVAKYAFKQLCHADGTQQERQLFMTATARVVWLWASVRYWPDSGLVLFLPRKISGLKNTTLDENT